MHRQRHAFSHSRSISRAHAPTKYIWVSRVAKHYLFEALFCFSNINTGTHSLTHSLTISAIVGITMCESTREWERARHEPPSNGTFFFRFCLLFFVIFTSVRCVCVCFLKTGAYIWNRHSNELCMECREENLLKEKKEAKNCGVGGRANRSRFYHSAAAHTLIYFFSLRLCCIFFSNFILYHRVPDLWI